MTAQVAEWAPEKGVAAEGHNILLGVDRQRGVLDQRVEDVGRHPLVYVPIAGFIL